VLAVDVPPQVDLALERPLLADVARERLEAGVLATVRDEVRRLAERLAALTTRVRLLTFAPHNVHFIHTADALRCAAVRCGAVRRLVKVG